MQINEKHTCVVPQYYVENNNEATIPKHLSMLVHEELEKSSLPILVKMRHRRNFSSNHSFCSNRIL